MSTVSLERHERRRKQRELKEQQKRQGISYPPTFSLPNRKSDLKTVEEEASVQLIAEEQLKVYGQLLPELLKKLSRIDDPRKPEENQAPDQRFDVLWNDDVCFSRRLQAASEPGNDHTAVVRKSASALS